MSCCLSPPICALSVDSINYMGNGCLHMIQMTDWQTWVLKQTARAEVRKNCASTLFQAKKKTLADGSKSKNAEEFLLQPKIGECWTILYSVQIWSLCSFRFSKRSLVWMQTLLAAVESNCSISPINAPLQTLHHSALLTITGSWCVSNFLQHFFSVICISIFQLVFCPFQQRLTSMSFSNTKNRASKNNLPFSHSWKTDR